MNPARQLVYDLKQAMPSGHQQESFESLLSLFLQANGAIRLSHSQGKSASSLSRFLNHYHWPCKQLWGQLRRWQLEQLLKCAQRGRPRLQVIVDLTSLEKAGEFAELTPYMHSLDGKRGVHLVVVYLVFGQFRIPWSLRLWQGAGTASPAQLALAQLKQLPECLRQRYRLMVLADGGFGTVTFLEGVKALNLPAVVTLRADRRLEDGRQLHEIRGCEVVRPTKLGLTVWATRLRLKGRGGQPDQWRHVVSTQALCGTMIKRWGRRRFAIEGFFKVIKHRFGLHCFAQCTRLGVYRWFLFSLLAYVLTYQAHLSQQLQTPPDWQAAARQALQLYLPEYLCKLVLIQVEKLSHLGRSLGFEVRLCNCKI